jgi:hypothetical protein
VNFSGFYRSLGYIYLPSKKKGGKKGAKKGAKKDVKKATVNNPIVFYVPNKFPLLFSHCKKSAVTAVANTLLSEFEPADHGIVCLHLVTCARRERVFS